MFNPLQIGKMAKIAKTAALGTSLGLASTLLPSEDVEASILKKAQPLAKETVKMLKTPEPFESSSKSILEGASFWGKKIINVLKPPVRGDLRYLVLEAEDGAQSQVAMNRDQLTTLVSKTMNDLYTNKKWTDTLSEAKKMRMTIASKEMRKHKGAFQTKQAEAEKWNDTYIAKLYHILDNPETPYQVKSKDLVDNVTVSISDIYKDTPVYFNLPRKYAEYIERMLTHKKLPENFRNSFEDFKIVAEPDLKSYWDPPSKTFLKKGIKKNKEPNTLLYIYNPLSPEKGYIKNVQAKTLEEMLMKKILNPKAQTQTFAFVKNPPKSLVPHITKALETDAEKIFGMENI